MLKFKLGCYSPPLGSGQSAGHFQIQSETFANRLVRSFEPRTVHPRGVDSPPGALTVDSDT